MDNFKKFLLDSKTLPPDGGSPTFKFGRPGDVIVAEYFGRRHGVKAGKTKADAIVLDVDIKQSETSGCEGPTGLHSIFESTAITQIMDREVLQKGEFFLLRFHSLDSESGFKRFTFKRFTFEPISSTPKAGTDDGEAVLVGGVISGAE